MDAVNGQLRVLANVDPARLKIGLGNEENRRRFHAALRRAIALGRGLTDLGLAGETLDIGEHDLKELLRILDRSVDSLTEFRDGGEHVLGILDRITALLAAAAAAHGHVLQSLGGELHLVPAQNPTVTQFGEIVKSLEKAFTEVQVAVSSKTATEVGVLLDEIRQAKEQAARLLGEAAKDVTKIKVGDYHAFFAATSARHRASARYWLITTAALAAIAVGTSFGFVWAAFNPTSVLSASATLEGAIARAVTVAVLVSATIWAGLNFRSHQHNAVVNQHRGDALGSFDAFWSAASTKEAKDAVLVQASSAIYLGQPSGFVGRDGDSSTSGIGLLAGLLAARGDR